MNTQEKFAAKKAEAIQKLEAEEKALNFLESIELLPVNQYGDANYIYHSNNSIGFGWRVPLSLAEAREVLAKLPAADGNYTFKVSDKQVTTFSPFHLKINNYDHGHTNVKIEYLSQSGYGVSIEIKDSQYSRDICTDNFRNLRHRGFGRYDRKRIFKFDVFGNVNWYGDGQTVYAETPEEKEEFETAIFYGHVPEFKEFWQKQLAEK